MKKKLVALLVFIVAMSWTVGAFAISAIIPNRVNDSMLGYWSDDSYDVDVTGYDIEKWSDGDYYANGHGGQIQMFYDSDGWLDYYLRTYFLNDELDMIEINFTPSGSITQVICFTDHYIYDEENGFGAWNTVYEWDFLNQQWVNQENGTVTDKFEPFDPADWPVDITFIDVIEVKEITVKPAILTGDFKVGSAITATMNAENAFAYNYWLFNDQGVIVQELTNTTDTSWTFTVNEPGIYLLRTYATDFETEDWTDTDWFAIEGATAAAPAVTVSNVAVSGDYKAGAPLTGTASIENGLAFNYWLFNDQGVIVAEHTNTTDTAWSFSVATPGLYLLRVYATDFLTEDWNDSEWFYVTEAVSANPVKVSAVSLSEANIHAGDTMTVVPSVSGGSGLYAYNYWVFNTSGVIVKEKTNTLDSSASFTFTEPGVYLIRVYATDFETEDYTDSAWFSVVAAPAEQADEQPVEVPAAETPADEAA